MSAAILIITATNIVTSAGSWEQLRVQDDSVVLSGSVDEGGVAPSLVVAHLPCEEDAQEMFMSINQRIVVGAHLFDART